MVITRKRRRHRQRQRFWNQREILSRLVYQNVDIWATSDFGIIGGSQFDLASRFVSQEWQIWRFVILPTSWESTKLDPVNFPKNGKFSSPYTCTNAGINIGTKSTELYKLTSSVDQLNIYLSEIILSLVTGGGCYDFSNNDSYTLYTVYISFIAI